MRLSRRTFLKGSAAAGATVVASRFLLGGPDLLATKDAEMAEQVMSEDWVPTTCWVGKQDCGILARRINGRVVKLEGHPAHPLNRGTLCPKGVGQITALYDYNRVKTPLIRTNGKGVAGQFREASWDEALTLVAEKLNEVRARDPKMVLWQKGRSKQKDIYDTAFVKTIGSSKLGHGSYCSDAGYRAGEYTLGLHGNAHPDFRYNKYLLNWGWNAMNGGGNKFCQITWHQQFLEARERGMKVVTIDPTRRNVGPYTDQWLPIKPGTDLAMALALCNAIIAQGTIDVEYLTKHTNSPFLVKQDGAFLRVDDKEQVWDTTAGAAVAFDTEGATPALDGAYTVAGQIVKTGFQAFKEHVAGYTPEWAAGICDIPAEITRGIARELGENALIGSTIVVDGVTLPYRPVAIMAYHMAQQELGFQMFRAMYMVMMLLGSPEAVGGQRVDKKWSLHKNFAGIENGEVKDPPYDFILSKSKFFPINTGNPGMVAKVMLDPAKYEVEKIPEMVIIFMANPLASFTDQGVFMEAYKKFKFVAVIDPWLSLTADLFADVVLPASTMEKYEGPISATDTYTDAKIFRLPVMEPLWQSRGDFQIYLDLCEKAGLLFGEDGYVDRVNAALGLKDEHALDLNTKPTPREVFDRWSRSQNLEGGIEYFEKNGIWLKGPISASKYYGTAQSPPFDGIRQRLYGEALLRYQREMREKGAKKIYWQDYTAFPTWRPLTLWSSPAQYDLTLISYKKIEFKQSRTPLPLVRELAPQQRLAINPATAKAKGIKDGDEVLLESHNAITDERRKVNVIVEYTETIRPDVVGLPHHYGDQAKHPWTTDEGPTPNTLFFTGEGYVTNTADNTFHVRVRVQKA